MWHEQRKEEKRIRGMLVDRRKRAERRRDYYEKIRGDPNQFLQVSNKQVLFMKTSFPIGRVQCYSGCKDVAR